MGWFVINKKLKIVPRGRIFLFKTLDRLKGCLFIEIPFPNLNLCGPGRFAVRAIFPESLVCPRLPRLYGAIAIRRMQDSKFDWLSISVWMYQKRSLAFQVCDGFRFGERDPGFFEMNAAFFHGPMLVWRANRTTVECDKPAKIRNEWAQTHRVNLHTDLHTRGCKMGIIWDNVRVSATARRACIHPFLCT